MCVPALLLPHRAVRRRLWLRCCLWRVTARQSGPPHPSALWSCRSGGHSTFACLVRCGGLWWQGGVRDRVHHSTCKRGGDSTLACLVSAERFWAMAAKHGVSRAASCTCTAEYIVTFDSVPVLSAAPLCPEIHAVLQRIPCVPFHVPLSSNSLSYRASHCGAGERSTKLAVELYVLKVSSFSLFVALIALRYR